MFKLLFFLSVMFIKLLNRSLINTAFASWIELGIYSLVHRTF